MTEFWVSFISATIGSFITSYATVRYHEWKARRAEFVPQLKSGHPYR